MMTMANWQPLPPQPLRHDVVRRSEEEIAEVMDRAADTVEQLGSPIVSASSEQAAYARGVSDGIAWLLGQSEDNPKENI